MDTPELNAHNKQEYPPMHTAEHILNATMVRTFGCGRHVNAHVERTKSKLDYQFPRPLTPDEVADRFPLERLPEGASDTVRVVHVGDYDECLCAGAHVEHTAQIGQFRISSTRHQDGRLRIVFRLTQPE